MMKFLLIFCIFLAEKVSAQHYKILSQPPESIVRHHANSTQPCPTYIEALETKDSDSFKVLILVAWSKKIDDHVYVLDSERKWREYLIFSGQTVVTTKKDEYIKITIHNPGVKKQKYRFHYMTGECELIRPALPKRSLRV